MTNQASSVKIIDGKIAMSLAKQLSNRVDPTFESKQTLKLLTQSFPAAFNLKQRKPLKTGIKNDLQSWTEEHEVSNKALRAALKYYTNGNGYLQAMIDETHRIDLSGSPCETITEAQKQHAKMLLEKRSAQRQEKS